MMNKQSDIESYKSSSASTPAPKASSSSSAASSSKSAPAPASTDYEDVPASSMRKIIGQRLLESKVTVPHYYVTVEVNMGESRRCFLSRRERGAYRTDSVSCGISLSVDRVMKLREMFNKASEGKSKLSVNDFSEWLERGFEIS